MRRRPLALVLLASAAPAVLVLARPVAAADDAGSAFQSMSLGALAGGLQVSGDGLAGQPPGSAAASLPMASARLTGSTSHGLASVAWPGSLAADAGSLLLLLGPNPCVPGDDPVAHQPIPVAGGTCDTAAPVPQPVMDNYHYLNDPVRADAQSPARPSADQSAPGARMQATAVADKVTATAQLGGGLTTDGLGFGTVTSAVTAAATGPQEARTTATSVTHHVDLAAGVLTIDSVTSTATTSTTGATATATGGTTVQGMRVAGIPVTVDGQGLHAGGSGVSTTAATEVVAKALTSAGIRLYLTAPTRTVDAGAAHYHAGALVILWDVDQKGPKDDVVVVLGGADSSSVATLPYAFVPGVSAGVPGASTAPLAGTALPAGTAVSGATAAVTGPTLAGSQGTPPAPTPAGPGSFLPVSFGRPLALGWLALVVLGTGLVAFGGGRLPELLLRTPTAQCVEGATRRED